MEEKLEFHLVPVSGTLKSKGGFRAELKKGFRDQAIDFDGVIAETVADNRWTIDPELLKLYMRGVLSSMLKKTSEDGRTRKIDDFFSVSLNIHGRFSERTDDFDPALHKLRLVLRPLLAFRVLGPKKSVLPVNVNRIPQFRITSFTAADGLHKSHTVVFGQDLVVKGSNLTIDKANGGFLSLNAIYSGREFASRGLSTKVISHSDTEIRFAWPEDLGAEEARGQRLVVTVWKATRGADMDKMRDAKAWIRFE